MVLFSFPAIQKTDEIIKIENALKKAKIKQKENIKKVNSELIELIILKLKEDDKFKKDFQVLLELYSLNNIIDLFNKNYEIFNYKTIE